MKQIDYFKFTKEFPDYIDINDTNDVKSVLLSYIRKNKKSKLLPINIKKIKIEELKNCDLFLNHFKFQIKYKKQLILTICFVRGTIDIIYHNYNNFMDINEISNLKRTILIDDILK